MQLIGIMSDNLAGQFIEFRSHTTLVAIFPGLAQALKVTVSNSSIVFFSGVGWTLPLQRRMCNKRKNYYRSE